MASVNEHLQIESVLNSYATSFCAVNDASVELGISWSRRLDRPMISTYRLFLENPHSTGWPPTKAKNELFAEIEFNAHAPRVLLSKLVTDHPAMIPISDWDCRGEQDRDDTGRLDMFYRDPNESCLAACMRDVVKFYQRIQGPPALADASPFEQILLQSQPSALPLGEGPIEIALRDWSDIRASLGPKDAEEAWKLFRLASDVAHELSRILTLPLESLRGCLRTFRYLGPLRKIPPRSFRTPRVRDGSRWADGQAAWDELASGDEQLIESVNHWLARDDRLNTGYRIAYRRFKEITLERVQTLEYLLGELPETLAGVTERVRTSVIGELRDAPSVNRLMLEDIAREIDVEPHDVGVGIAQLVPVVVAALSGRGVLNVIEQPELHVHPRLQAELGDLFIEACRTRDQRFIIETHSEHLILRLLRRIRETGKGAAYRGMAITPDDVAVYYVAAEGTQTTVRKIDIDTRGEFVQPWPDDFFEIDFHERFA